jgi:hypothetical protein
MKEQRAWRATGQMKQYPPETMDVVGLALREDKNWSTRSLKTLGCTPESLNEEVMRVHLVHAHPEPHG